MEFGIEHTALASVLTYFRQANLAGQTIVWCLIACSLVAWTVMIGKYLDLARLRSLNRRLEHSLPRVGTLLGGYSSLDQPGIGPYADLLRAALGAYRRSGAGRGSTALAIGQVENALQRGVSGATVLYESKMVMLGSIVTGAPFLGLLGTVWGVMDAFGAIALRSTASIQLLAPGVSGALLTTVAGLLVAIPSVFGYNFLLTQTKIMTTELENFASSVADQIELEFRERDEGGEGEE